jgi:DNA polymerase-3 subunit beta
VKIRSTSGMLASLLEMASRAVSPRPTAQLLQAVLFEARDGVVTVSATDAEISISVSAQAAVEEEGRAAIPAKLLLRYAKSLPEGEAELSADEGGGEATLACAKSSVALRCYSPADFPTFPAFPESEAFEVDAAALAGAIGRVLPFVSGDESRPVLTGVLVAFADGSVRMVATDSYRMGLNEQRLEGSEARGGTDTAIVPGHALKEAARLANLAGEKGRVGVALTGNRAMFRARGLTLSCRLIEGNFPEYERLLPDGFAEEFHANRAELLAALRRARLVAGSSAQNSPVPVRLAFSHPEGTLGGGEITISLRVAETGAATEVIAAEVPEGTSFEAYFNPDYLADAVASLSSERIALRFNEPLKPAVLQAPAEAEQNGGAAHLCLVMPMRDPDGGNDCG